MFLSGAQRGNCKINLINLNQAFSVVLCYHSINTVGKPPDVPLTQPHDNPPDQYLSFVTSRWRIIFTIKCSRLTSLTALKRAFFQALQKCKTIHKDPAKDYLRLNWLNQNDFQSRNGRGPSQLSANVHFIKKIKYKWWPNKYTADFLLKSKHYIIQCFFSSLFFHFTHFGFKVFKKRNE